MQQGKEASSLPALEKKSVRDISRVWKSTGGTASGASLHLFFRLAGLPGRRLRSDKLTSATPNKMASSPLATLAVRGSPNASAEESTPITGTPRKPSEVVMAGKARVTVKAPQ